MIFKLVHAFQRYWSKVLMHISGQNCNLCFFVCQQNFKTLLCVVVWKIGFKVYIENDTCKSNKTFLLNLFLIRFIETEYKLDVIANSYE